VRPSTSRVSRVKSTVVTPPVPLDPMSSAHCTAARAPGSLREVNKEFGRVVGRPCDTCPVSSDLNHRMADVVDRLASVPSRDDRLRHPKVLPPRAATSTPWPGWSHPVVERAFRERGVGTPWRHQVTAADAAWAGAHAVLATGTASGKSMAYQLPVLTTLLNSRGARDERGATALYLSPTKALAQDQLAGLTALRTGVRVTTHDGDSSREQRDWARDHGEYLLTNPDMLHRSLLPAHHRWAKFLGSLRYVVIDECHHYRGVFGAHVAQVVRRLRRV